MPALQAASSATVRVVRTDRVLEVAGVVLRDGRGRVLTVRKHGTTRFMLPGGKLAPGESPREAALREVREEVGLSPDPETVLPLGTFRAEAANEPGHEVIAHVFTVAPPPSREPHPTAEIEELRWLDPDRAIPGELAPLLVRHVLPRLVMTAPPTPYLVVDRKRVLDTLDRTSRLAATAGLTLRPHVKTHKSPDLARLQLAAGAVGISVATLGEAEVFVGEGFDDVFVAYPLWLTQDAAARVRRLAERATITLGVDSPAAAAHMAALLGDTPVRVLVEVDSGHHRSGTSPADAGDVAAAARRARLDLRGVFTFPGHSYAPAARAAAAQDERQALAVAAEMLQAVGVAPEVVSGGSSPSLAESLAEPGPLTELRPGVYVFGDAQQWELGAVVPGQVALTCCATVVSHAGGRLVLDCGSKVLGADRAPWATGFGRLFDHPEARIVQLSEHHAVVDLAGAPLPPLGSTVAVVPNHVCNAVNLVEDLYLVDGARLARWPVAARGRNG